MSTLSSVILESVFKVFNIISLLRMLLNVFCHMKFENYPFDSQNCSVKLESKSLSTEQLILKWHETEPFNLMYNFYMTGFHLIDYSLINDSVVQFENDKVSRIAVLFNLKRDWINLLLEIYLPTCGCVIMSWLSFWLKISASPARVTLGMTTMLTLATHSVSSREKLPQISYINYLDIYIVACICKNTFCTFVKNLFFKFRFCLCFVN